MQRGTVIAIFADGRVLVRSAHEQYDELVCDVLHTSNAAPLHLDPGDVVLLWISEEAGVILGRVGTKPSAERSLPVEREVPDELVIEAAKNLTLRCGEGSITLREDGKILIKGKDLVSRAQRMNRIKGGAVSIN
jgi:hypothetical protein